MKEKEKGSVNPILIATLIVVAVAAYFYFHYLAFF